MDFKNMDKGAIIKYVAIAIGVYFVYKYITTGSLFGDTLPATALPPGATIPGQTIPGASPPAALISAPAATGPTDSQLMAAAFEASQAGQAGSYKLNVWQWNFYRQQEAVKRGVFDAAKHQPALDAYTDPSKPVTAAEYHAVLASAGLSGMGMGWSNNPTSGYSRWRN